MLVGIYNGGFMEKLIVGQSLEKQLQELICNVAPTGAISYVVTRLSDGEEPQIVAAFKETMIHVGASMVKTLILEYVFHLAYEGQLDLHDTIALSRSPRVAGAGVLQELMGNHSFTYLELCRLMMVISDNWATNLLIQALGMEYINARAHQLGLEHFEINRFMMDTLAVQEGRDNYITALDMAKLLHHIYNLRYTLEGHEMWSILGRQQFRDILPFHWGEDVVFHHKTGSLENVEHDAGILETMNGDFCFVMLMSHVRNDVAKQLGAQVGLRMKEFVEDALP